MMQVENEVGVLGSTRDHSPAAEKAFAGAVPDELMRYLEADHSPRDPRVEAGLNDELRALWEANGAKHGGTWTEVFGDSGRTDEIFMAWHYARYVQAVAAAGKRSYPLPMYANAWLGGGDTAPGDYPSGGPQPRVLDIWKAAGSSLDMIAPDLYASDFAGWSSRYHRVDNPLFIPETNGGVAGAANVFYAIGEQAAIGFSPFAIDAGLHGEASANTEAAASGNAELARSYQLLVGIVPQILAAQAGGVIHGFTLDKSHPAVTFVIDGVTLAVSLDQVFGRGSESGYGLIFEDGSGSFVGAGRGFRVAFESRSASGPQVGLERVVEGRYERDMWVPGRTLNGDENDQGTHWRFDGTAAKIERATIYRFE